jgi:hypothetical protein
MNPATRVSELRNQFRARKGFAEDLARCSADTGIPRQELRQMCLRAGLDQLIRGELKVKSVSQVIVGLDPTKVFSPSEIEDIDSEAKRQELTRDEFLVRAIQTGIQRCRNSEDEKLPLMLPSWIVQRLADVGRVADLEHPDTAIAEAVLGDLARSPACIKDTVTEAFVLRAPKATAKKIDRLIAGWSKDLSKG